MAPPFSVGRIPTKPLTLWPTGIFVVNDDPAEVADIRARRSAQPDIAESVKKLLRSIVFQEIGSIETRPPRRGREHCSLATNFPLTLVSRVGGSSAAPLIQSHGEQ